MFDILITNIMINPIHGNISYFTPNKRNEQIDKNFTQIGRSIFSAIACARLRADWSSDGIRHMCNMHINEVRTWRWAEIKTKSKRIVRMHESKQQSIPWAWVSDLFKIT